jgi:hypothetical protein
MTSVLCFRVRWSGGVRELRINSPGVLQVRKEEIEVEDLIGDGFGRKSGWRLEEEGGPDGWTRGVSQREWGKG